ncbi:MAG: T9SS type A sorting domain-containing protein, partial [Bacteroidota bacterium]
ADQVITIEAIEDKLTSDASFDVIASVDTGLELEYAVSGPASISGTTVTLDGNSGTVTVTVSQAGNENYNEASESTSFLVSDPAKSDQTITFESIDDQVFGDDAFNLSATASSGLEVTFTVVSGPISINGNTITINGAGTAIIAANQGGNETFNPAPEVTQTFEIAKADQSISFVEITDKEFGDDPFDLVATASSGLEVTFVVASGPATVSGNTITIDGAGMVTIAANQAGNANFNAAAEVAETFIIAKADQVITIESVEDKLTTDDPFDVIASVNSGLALTYEVTGPATLSDNTVTLTGASGTVSITVSQAGNDNYNEASESISFTVSDASKQDQSITFDEISDKVFGDAPFALTGTASSGLAIQFTVVSGPVTISGAMVTIEGAGTTVIAANQAGNDEFNPAQEVTRTFQVAKSDQAITIETIENKTISDSPFDVTASVTSGLELTYEVSGPASITEQTVTLSGVVGTVTVTVSQDVNDNYTEASECISFEVTEQILSVELGPKVQFYPNPVTDYLIIDSNELVEVAIFNLEGREIKSEVMSQGRIDVSTLSKGVYLLKFKNGSYQKTERFIKAN